MTLERFHPAVDRLFLLMPLLVQPAELEQRVGLELRIWKASDQRLENLDGLRTLVVDHRQCLCLEEHRIVGELRVPVPLEQGIRFEDALRVIGQLKVELGDLVADSGQDWIRSR